MKLKSRNSVLTIKRNIYPRKMRKSCIQTTMKIMIMQKGNLLNNTNNNNNTSRSNER